MDTPMLAILAAVDLPRGLFVSDVRLVADVAEILARRSLDRLPDPGRIGIAAKKAGRSFDMRRTGPH
jgi:hypothetical protein